MNDFLNSYVVILSFCIYFFNFTYHCTSNTWFQVQTFIYEDLDDAPYGAT